MFAATQKVDSFKQFSSWMMSMGTIFGGIFFATPHGSGTYFRMHGANNFLSMVLGSTLPTMNDATRAIIMVVIAPKHVYHIYDMRYSGKISLKL